MAKVHWVDTSRIAISVKKPAMIRSPIGTEPLSAIRDSQKATKGVIVTTSHLTRGAIDWIRTDEFRLEYQEREDIERWVLNSL